MKSTTSPPSATSACDQAGPRPTRDTGAAYVDVNPGIAAHEEALARLRGDVDGVAQDAAVERSPDLDAAEVARLPDDRRQAIAAREARRQMDVDAQPHAVAHDQVLRAPLPFVAAERSERAPVQVDRLRHDASKHSHTRESRPNRSSVDFCAMSPRVRAVRGALRANKEADDALHPFRDVRTGRELGLAAACGSTTTTTEEPVATATASDMTPPDATSVEPTATAYDLAADCFGRADLDDAAGAREEGLKTGTTTKVEVRKAEVLPK
jgi:hypothetical protein